MNISRGSVFLVKCQTGAIKSSGQKQEDDQIIMKIKNSKCLLVFLTVLFTLAFAAPAFAYIDPGTGSVVYQTVIVIFLAAAATGRLWWNKLKTLFGGNFTKKGDKDKNEE